MKSHSTRRERAFTIAELIVAGGVAMILSVAIMIYTSSALRMVARNLATNHSHESARGSMERLLSDVHNSATRFQLMSFDGTNYTDVTATVTSDKDVYSNQYISNRANGVRFLRKAGGPYKLTGNGTATSVAATDTTLEFDFSGGTYTPATGDKLEIPLLSREFDITTPAPVRTTGNKWKITIGNAVGFSVITATGTTTSGQSWTNPVTTACFYQRVGYTVWNNQLRFHPYLTDPPYPKAAVSTDIPVVVRSNLTSPKPFGLLFPTSSATLTDATTLRVSLESYDTRYSARVFQNGTTTLQAVVPSRNQPPILTSN